MSDDPDLDGAYGLRTPEDNKAYYARWADSYEDGFVHDMGYILHAQVAEIFAGHASPDDAPVLDVGSGTGVLAEALLGHGSWPIDGVDISREMLAEAEAKGLYGQLFEADLTQPLPRALRRYGGVVSSGTLTHGHLGPDLLERLLDAARPGGLFVLSINAEHFEERGFAEAFEALETMIEPPIFVEVPIYANAAGTDHEEDTALIAVYRRR